MSESKQNEIKSAKLAEDVKACLEEIKPILAKYQLDIAGKLSVFHNGIAAIPEFIRAQPKDEPKPSQ